MKTTFKIMAFLLCVIFIQDGFGQIAQVTRVKYLIKYNTTTCRYDCNIVIDSIVPVGATVTVASARAQLNAQYSIVVPTGVGLTIAQNYNPIQGNISGTLTVPPASALVWTNPSTRFAPAADPLHDFYSITPTLSPTSFYGNMKVGDTIRLFAINLTSVDCNNPPRPFINGVDPGPSAPGMAGGDFNNGFTIGTTAQDYKSNLPTIPPPKPVVSGITSCTPGISIDLSASTSSCQTPLMYSWTGPAGYTGNTQDVNINPASATTNGGNYQVTVTDNLGCSSTFAIAAFPKPNAGANVQLCAPGIANLTGTNPTTGTWTALNGGNLGATNNGMVSVDLSAQPLGTYNFVYSANNCSDTVSVIIGGANAGPDPEPISCFSTDVVNLAAVGTGLWSIGAGSAGTASFTASNPNTTVSQFSAPGNYFFVWTSSGGCTDTVLIVTNNNCGLCVINNNNITQPTSNTFCGSSENVTINGSTALPAGGVYNWQVSLNSGAYSSAPGTNNTEDYTTQILTTGVYNFRRIYTSTTQLGNSCMDTSNVVTITVNAIPPIPSNLSNPGTICLGNGAILSVTNNPGATYTWTASSPDVGLSPSTTNSASISPTAAGSYTVSVTQTVNGCQSNAASVNINVIATPPTPSGLTGIDPTSCGGNNGSITMSGFTPSTNYTVTYSKNGIPVTLPLSSNASGVITIPNLTSGTYTNFSVTQSGCASGIAPGPVVLTDPNAPGPPTNINATNQSICVGTTVTVSVTGAPGATFTWSVSNAGVLTPQSPSTTNTITYIGLAPGSTTVSVTQSLGGCISPPATINITVVANPTTPSASAITSVNPTTCQGTDGSISISGYLPSTNYTLFYTKNGVSLNMNVVSNASGVIILSGLDAGTYGNFKVANAAGCESGTFAGPVLLSDPGNTLPTNLRGVPNPVCIGSSVTLTVDNVQGATYSWSVSDVNAGLSSSTSNTTTLNPSAAGSYTVSVTQTVAGCVSPPSTLVVLVRADCYNPDFGVTFANVLLTGDLSTNDDANSPSYGSAIPVGSNPSACIPTIASNGTYTFNCTTLGEYNFIVNSCTVDDCVNVPLTITVIEEESQTNPPIANHDYTATKTNTPITINVLANDKCQSVPNCTFDIPTITTLPAHGSFNPNTGLYTPTNGYSGRDSFRYRVCQSPSTPVSCDEEWVYINIFPSASTNFTNAMDDYGQTSLNTPLVVNASKGLKANDLDVEGNSTSINAFNSTVTGKGSLNLAADGSYTFTPATGFIGPVDFPYQICDTGNPTACDSATLHILVNSSLPVGAIGDFVWHDTNGNGIQNPGEPGIANVIVRLYTESGSFVSQKVTPPNGSYLFTDILIGNYYLLFIPSDEYLPTFTGKGTTATDSDVTGFFGPGTTNLIAVNPGETNLTIDAGYYICSKIGNYVWYDDNKNDIFDSYENGINGLQVNLWRNSGAGFVLWDTEITGHNPDPAKPSDDGWYQFCAPPGTFYIQIILPPNNKLVTVKPFIGGNPFRDSDINHANGPVTTGSFTLNSGQNKLDIGGGFYPMAVAGNLVWLDENYDGIQDANEPKVANVLVEAFDANSGVKLRSAYTNEDGVYEIDYLEKRDIFYKFSPPDGYNPTYPNAGDDKMNSDVDHSFGLNTTRMFSMQPDVFNANIDLGLAFGVLPVKWAYVNVKQVAEGHKLTWGTTAEVNLDYFIVERQLASETDFVSISGNISPSVKQSPVKHYDFIDENTAQFGWHHYRIRQYDFDGSSALSEEVSIFKDSEADISLYPNPTINKVNINLNLKEDANVIVSIYGINGALISKMTTNKNYNQGSHILSADLSGLPSGSYNFSIDINGKLINKMVVKE